MSRWLSFSDGRFSDGSEVGLYKKIIIVNRNHIRLTVRLNTQRHNIICFFAVCKLITICKNEEYPLVKT